MLGRGSAAFRLETLLTLELLMSQEFKLQQMNGDKPEPRNKLLCNSSQSGCQENIQKYLLNELVTALITKTIIINMFNPFEHSYLKRKHFI